MQQQRSRHVNKHEIGDSVKLHKGMLALLRQLGVGRRHLTGGAAGHSYHSGDLACAKSGPRSCNRTPGCRSVATQQSRVPTPDCSWCTAEYAWSVTDTVQQRCTARSDTVKATDGRGEPQDASDTGDQVRNRCQRKRACFGARCSST